MPFLDRLRLGTDANQVLSLSGSNDNSAIGAVTNAYFGSERIFGEAQGALALGGTITFDGNNVTHTFTESGDFIIEKDPDQGFYDNVEILMIGGGGAGGNGPGATRSGGGGGAGGFLFLTGSQISELTVDNLYPVVVGEGGGTGTPANSGTNTTFLGYTARGGGRGGDILGPNSPGQGGCGGGAYDNLGSGLNGASFTANITGSIYNDNIAENLNSNGYASDGTRPGGGGGIAGTNATSDHSDDSGPGLTLSFPDPNTPTLYGAGGGTATGTNAGACKGRGGDGGHSGGPSPTAGTDGIVIIKYPNPLYSL